MVTRKRKGGLQFRKKKKNKTRTQNRANVRDLTYDLAKGDFIKPGSSGIMFNEYEKLRPNTQVPKYRKLAEEIIEGKANNGRTRRRKRLALMKRKGGKRKKRKKKKTKKRRAKN
jgi:hypothetical protein